ncbi:hypothetical protein, partial [Plasmodium yoelii yoelii]
LDEIIIKFNSR